MHPSAVLRQVAFVSGAGRGIGRAIAIKLAQDGFDVAVNDIPASEDALKATAATIQDLGRKSTTVPGDISSRASVEAAIDKTVADLGSLNVCKAENCTKMPLKIDAPIGHGRKCRYVSH